VARQRARRSRPKPGRSQAAERTSPTARTADEETAAALDDIQRVLDTPLPELMGTEEERTEAQVLARQVADAPVVARLREVVGFVGSGLPATQAGNLKVVDALALARRLGGACDALVEDIRAMDDLPDVAFLFRWAIAAELVARRGPKIVTGSVAVELERDPLAAWLRVAITRLEHGPLDGFRRGWRKRYVELLDANAVGLLAAIAEADGTVPLAEIEDSGWEQIVDRYGYQPDDRRERRIAVALIGALVNELVELGALARRGDEVVLTGLGSLLVFVVLADVDDIDDSDAVQR